MMSSSQTKPINVNHSDRKNIFLLNKAKRVTHKCHTDNTSSMN